MSEPAIQLPDHDDRHTALTDFQHNLVVTAGAGTGKTSLLVGRLVAALVVHHLDPQQVLAVTFTDNAAGEMQERLVRVLNSIRPFVEAQARGEVATKIDASDHYILAQLGLGPENLSRVDELLDQVESLAISTFHGFCLNFLREHAREFELPPDIGIGDTDRTHTGFETAFLEHLQEASTGDVHPALRRFTASQLRELALACIQIPAESLARIDSIPLPEDLAHRHAELADLIGSYPKARKAWKNAAAILSETYQTLRDGGSCNTETFPKSIPKAGKRELGDAHEIANAELEEHLQFLSPFALADQEGVAMAIDFVAPVLKRYRRHITARGELGFQDLLLLTRHYLQSNAAARQAMGRRTRAILVDEFQDTDPLQYDVVFLLAADPDKSPGEIADPMELTLRPGCLFIVGDAKQSIYRFRRADVAAFARAVDCILGQGGARLELTANFRSRKPILDLVNAVCQYSLREDRPFQFGYVPVVPMRSGDAIPTILELTLEDDKPKAGVRRQIEGQAVCSKIHELHEAGHPYKDVAILLRATTDTSWILRPLRTAGIPYVLEGSRRFYRRQEVVLCGALLGAMARPHDGVAVLALLRSSLSQANDGDIADYLRNADNLDFRSIRGEGPVAKTLRFLAQLHAQAWALPIDEALTQLLTLPELRLAEALGFEGAQRLANIERLLQKLLLRQPVDLIEAASSIAQHTDLETDDEESPLFDGGVDAVRILTTHGSKGLEFPIVFVPDLARKSAYKDGDGKAKAQRLFDHEGHEVVTVQIGTSRNIASLAYKETGKKHDQAEQRRLFYVAATRAKERLYLVTCPPSSGSRQLWDEDLDAGRALAQIEATEGELLVNTTAKEPLDPKPTLAAHSAFDAARKQAFRELPGADIAPSRKPSTAPEPSHAATPSAANPGDENEQAESAAIAIGLATHEYLATADLSATTVDTEILASLPHPQPVLAAVATIAAQYHASDFPQRIAAAEEVHREVPLSFLDTDGMVHGVIDLLLIEAEQRVSILDWKTDKIGPNRASQRAEGYRGQLETYGRGVMQAMALSAPPQLAVHFVRTGQTIEL